LGTLYLTGRKRGSKALLERFVSRLRRTECRHGANWSHLVVGKLWLLRQLKVTRKKDGAKPFRLASEGKWCASLATHEMLKKQRTMNTLKRFYSRHGSVAFHDECHWANADTIFNDREQLPQLARRNGGQRAPGPGADG
jgi:hypothetical protein